MSTPNNVALVQKLYEAFGKGDVQTILNALAPDVTWSADGPASLPFYGNRKGPAQVAQFFQAVGTRMRIHEFAPQEFIAQGDQVVVIGFERGEAVSTGKGYAGHWAHVFRIQGGKVVAFREFCDTAAIAAAFSGAALNAA